MKELSSEEADSISSDCCALLKAICAKSENNQLEFLHCVATKNSSSDENPENIENLENVVDTVEDQDNRKEQKAADDETENPGSQNDEENSELEAEEQAENDSDNKDDGNDTEIETENSVWK